MPFLLATTATDVNQAKAQAQKAQAAAYRHDVAWSMHSESPAVRAWVRAYAQNLPFPIFLSGPDVLPQAPAFVGPNGGYNVALALAFMFEQTAILVGETDLTDDAIGKLAEVDAECLQGACLGTVDDPLFWQQTVRQTLQSLHAGVVKAEFAARQLHACLDGTARSEKPWTCHEALSIGPNAVENACLPPFGPQPFDLYVNTAYFFHVRVLEPHFAWNRHPERPADTNRFANAWIAREKTEARLRILDYIIEKTRMRTVSDFLIDEALGNAYYAPKPAITSSQYAQIQALKRPSLAQAYTPLTQTPTLPEAAALKRVIKTFLAAQADWKDCLRSFGEQGLEEKLRVNKVRPT